MRGTRSKIQAFKRNQLTASTQEVSSLKSSPYKNTYFQTPREYVHKMTKTDDREPWAIRSYECDAPFIQSLSHVPNESSTQFKTWNSLKKTDFMSVLLEHKAKVPGPSHYEIPDKEGFEFVAKGKGVTFTKANRKTIID
jgi:hypothetical protein